MPAHAEWIRNNPKLVFAGYLLSAANLIADQYNPSLTIPAEGSEWNVVKGLVLGLAPGAFSAMFMTTIYNMINEAINGAIDIHGALGDDAIRRMIPPMLRDVINRRVLPAPEALPAVGPAALPAPSPVAADVVPKFGGVPQASPPSKPKGRPKLPKAPPLALPDVAKAPTPSPAPSAASASFGTVPPSSPQLLSPPQKRKPSGAISEAEIMSQAKAKYGGHTPYEMKAAAVPKTATSKAAAKKGIDELSQASSSTASPSTAAAAAPSSTTTPSALHLAEPITIYGAFKDYL